MNNKVSSHLTKVGKTPIRPIIGKISIVFAIFLLVSNLTSNYINLLLNRGVLQDLENRILVMELKELYSTASNQHDIYEFNGDLNATLNTIIDFAAKSAKRERSLALGVKENGQIVFWSSKMPRQVNFTDDSALSQINFDKKNGIDEGKLNFKIGDMNYFSIYKYNAKWNCYIIKAEEISDFNSDSVSIFTKISFIILFMTSVILLIGIIIIKRILKYVDRFTKDIMAMQETQEMGLINLEGAPNDDITYLGASFNQLSSTINTLLKIFKRFVTQDIAQKAYSDHMVNLEGQTRDLSILFTDIKGFTYMTETLGNDIIDVLNLHYDAAIRHIHTNSGIVGSIIGDALLAVFGTLKNDTTNKSIAALNAAVQIQQVAKELRETMLKKTQELIAKNGVLSDAEQRVLKAVMVEVGVGIDGGEVFYGNIGSYERMTNTVIGDNVNSASRLEGLTRIYQVPIICSEYIKNEASNAPFRFVELDTVQVKGKLIGKKIFWPVPNETLNPELSAMLDKYEEGLEKYYKGDWSEAEILWRDCKLPPMNEFRTRLESGKPAEWNGIWTMRTK